MTLAIDSALNADHIRHLLSEGFGESHIQVMVDQGCRSIDKATAMKRGFKVWAESERQWISSSGLYMPFSASFGQLRCDNPPDRNGKPAKYLTPAGCQINEKAALIPNGWIATTEGYKDAIAGTLLGGVPTAAVAGVSHIRKALPAGCKKITVFDADTWVNPNVARSLLKAAIHCQGKIAVIPSLGPDGVTPIHPQGKGGLCEFFKAGYGPVDYEALLNNAFRPHEFIQRWIDVWDTWPHDTKHDILRARCAKVATVYAIALSSKAAA